MSRVETATRIHYLSLLRRDDPWTSCLILPVALLPGHHSLDSHLFRSRTSIITECRTSKVPVSRKSHVRVDQLVTLPHNADLPAESTQLAVVSRVRHNDILSRRRDGRVYSGGVEHDGQKWRGARWYVRNRNIYRSRQPCTDVVREKELASSHTSTAPRLTRPCVSAILIIYVYLEARQRPPPTLHIPPHRSPLSPTSSSSNIPDSQQRRISSRSKPYGDELTASAVDEGIARFVNQSKQSVSCLELVDHVCSCMFVPGMALLHELITLYAAVEVPSCLPTSRTAYAVFANILHPQSGIPPVHI